VDTAGRLRRQGERTIPGVSDLTAQVIISEIGTDMSRFPTAGHLISWAGLCPRNEESAGKRRSTRLRKGASWLKTTLVQCAWAASRKKASKPSVRVFWGVTAGVADRGGAPFTEILSCSGGQPWTSKPSSSPCSA